MNPSTAANRAITPGGAHRLPLPFQRIREVDAERADAPHGRRCACCADLDTAFADLIATLDTTTASWFGPVRTWGTR